MSFTHLSDRELLEATVRAAAVERRTTVELITLLTELDSRRLYLGEGCSSLFTYCTQVLSLSEHAAYHRIEAARTAREFPVVLELLGEGALTLTTVALLRPHLTSDNHTRVLEAARHKTKREVEHQIACLAPKPDARPVVRKYPGPAKPAASLALQPVEIEPPPESQRPTPPVIRPIAPERYVVKMTVSAETHTKLCRAQDLLRHTIPNGDPAAILDRALTMLVEHLERSKMAKTRRPRASAGRRAQARQRTSSRYIPADVKRAVWARDEGRCAFQGPNGRCRETGHLEFHHVVPFAAGGPTEAANLALRCRAHNAFESEQRFGAWAS